MIKIKICGLSRPEDIEYVNKVRPDYVGFVFANSKRQVSTGQAKELINRLHEDIKTVGVFVNEDIELVHRISKTLSLNVLQFHGNENRQYIDTFKAFEVWKSVGINVNFPILF